MKEYHYKTIEELSLLIKNKKLSPVEITEYILKRISILDPEYKSYVTVMHEQAITSAQNAEKEIATGNYRGPLHGVPIAVKDLCFTKGVRTMGGCKVMENHIPSYDATVITKLNNAGAVLIGKLNLTEGAMRGYHPEFQVPVNPWNKDKWVGNSSSGSGVATALGLCFGSLGSDTGGSIRFPSACCGIVGLKPTWGRVSRYGILALAESLDHVGPMTRSSADAGFILQAIAGYDENDPTSLTDVMPDISTTISKDIKGIRIGFDEKYATEGVNEEVAKSVVDSLSVLKDLGAEIVDVKMPDISKYISFWYDIARAESILAHSEFYPNKREDYGFFYRKWLDTGSKITGSEYAHANNMRIECNSLIKTAVEPVDVLLTPTLIAPPHTITPEMLYGPSKLIHNKNFQKFTIPYDFNGTPTLCTPSGFTEDGLPLSIQFVGKHLSEPLLCQIGNAYEKLTGFTSAHPDV
tara:strand:+ start:109 stop:1506 length:1398 start_codon:yes stop_codon:yes gene_type:complete